MEQQREAAERERSKEQSSNSRRFAPERQAVIARQDVSLRNRPNRSNSDDRPNRRR
jgi:hypothetical protein